MFKRAIIVLFICINMVMLSAVPAAAYGRVEFSSVKTEDQLAAVTEKTGPGVFHIVSGRVKVSRSITIKTDDVLIIGQDPQADEGTIVIEDGGELVIDAPEIYTDANGHSNLIRVKKGGRLVLKSGSLARPTSVLPEIASTAVIEEGGVCEVHKGFRLINPDWDFKYLIDGKIKYIDDPYEPVEPEEPDLPEPEYDEEYYGEVVKVNDCKLMTIYFAMPLLDEEIESLTVQRFDGNKWEDRITYSKDEYMPDGYFRYSPDGVEEYLSWNHRQNTYSFLAYPEIWTEETAGQYVTYRIVYNYEDDYELSQSLDIYIPETGEPMPFTTEKDYDDVDGNRGGISQGESERHPVPEEKPGQEEKPEQNAKPEPETLIPSEKEEPSVKPEEKTEQNVKPEPEIMPPSAIEDSSVKPEEEEKQEADKETIASKENSSVYKETDPVKGVVPGVVIAIGATAGVACCAYGIARILRFIRR